MGSTPEKGCGFCFRGTDFSILKCPLRDLLPYRERGVVFQAFYLDEEK